MKKYRAGAVAVKFNIGLDTLFNFLYPDSSSLVSRKTTSVISEEQYVAVENAFKESLKLRETINSLRTNELKTLIIESVELVRTFKHLNDKLKKHTVQWPISMKWPHEEIRELYIQYLSKLPKSILADLEIENPDLIVKLQSLINEPKLEAEKKEREKKWYNKKLREQEDTYETGPYCGACESSPCMCSDPERTSMTWSF